MDFQTRRHFLQGSLALAGLGLLSSCGVLPSQTQRPASVPRIGFLAANSAEFMRAGRQAFRQGLQELGQVEGQTVVVDERYADGKLELLPNLTAELIRLRVDVIVAVPEVA